jgi:hypothetical protein
MMSLELRVAVFAAALITLPLSASTPAVSTERMTTTSQEAFICVSWAAWREYGLASLTARGAQMSKNCPLRLAAGTKVTVVEEDAEAGASVIRYRGKTWFIDNQRLK